MNKLKKVKYIYDYPENREVSKGLQPCDKKLIQEKTGFTRTYVDYWCRGKRKNAEIDRIARLIVETNKAKLAVIQQMHIIK
jgi:hypothetical protein